MDPIHLNKAGNRNIARFPEEFAFQLNDQEAANLKFQIGTSSSNQEQTEENQASWGGRRYLPWAFTEHGVLMAANVLRSPQAIEMSIYLVRALVRLRGQMSANEAILKRTRRDSGSSL